MISTGSEGAPGTPSDTTGDELPRDGLPGAIHGSKAWARELPGRREVLSVLGEVMTGDGRKLTQRTSLAAARVRRGPRDRLHGPVILQDRRIHSVFGVMEFRESCLSI